MIQKRVFVYGTVQGVTFRWSTSDLAREHGLKGWVRNLPDGRVEAVFQGKPQDVNQLVKWCHQGPERAKVEKVEVFDEKIDSNLNEFHTLRE